MKNAFAENRVLLCGEGSAQASLALYGLYLITSSPSMRRKTRTSATHFSFQILESLTNYILYKSNFITNIFFQMPGSVQHQHAAAVEAGGIFFAGLVFFQGHFLVGIF